MNLFRILCVGDDLPHLRSLRSGLGRYGFEVSTALHGDDARVQYVRRAHDLGCIVIDNDLPHGKGACFAAFVRELGFAGRIVVTSCCLKPSSLESFQTSNIRGVCSKPFEVGVLVTMLLQSD